MTRSVQELSAALQRFSSLLLMAPTGTPASAWSAADARAAGRRVFDLADPAVLRRLRAGDRPRDGLGEPPALVRDSQRLPALLAAPPLGIAPGDWLFHAAVRPRRMSARLPIVRWRPAPPSSLALESLLGREEAVLAQLEELARAGGDPISAASRGGFESSSSGAGAESHLAALLAAAEEHALRAAHPGSLDRLARALLTRSGEPLSIAAAARGARVPLETARRYLAALEAAQLLETLPAHAASEVRSAVLLPIDGPLAVRVGELPAVQALRLFALLALTRRASPELHLSHWATHAGARVDLLGAGPRGTIGVLLRERQPEDARSLRGLRSFLAAFPGARALVLSLEDAAVRRLAASVLGAPLRALVPAGAARRGPGRRERAPAPEATPTPREVEREELPAELL